MGTSCHCCPGEAVLSVSMGLYSNAAAMRLVSSLNSHVSNVVALWDESGTCRGPRPPLAGTIVLNCATVMKYAATSAASDVCTISPAGVSKIHGLPDNLSDYEKEGVQKAIPELRSSIEKGIKFVKEGTV